MEKTIFILLIWAFLQVLGDKNDWYPANANEIQRGCKEQHPVPSETIDQVQRGEINDSLALRAYILCAAKGLNVFSPGKGFDADRLAYALNRIGANRQCQRSRVRECVEKHKNVQADDAKAFSVVKCILDLEHSKADEDGPANTWKNCE
uniref:Odorant binding protein n=1 Tax=Stomoxys calcitrans TaxID=35570 RepID=A0A1I8NYX4_STOCA